MLTVGCPDVTPISCSPKHGSIGTSYPSCQSACRWGRLSGDTQSNMYIRRGYENKTRYTVRIIYNRQHESVRLLLRTNGEPGYANRQTPKRLVKLYAPVMTLFVGSTFKSGDILVTNCTLPMGDTCRCYENSKYELNGAQFPNVTCTDVCGNYNENQQRKTKSIRNVQPFSFLKDLI